MLQTNTAYCFADTIGNPCLGCISLSCTTCACAAERQAIVEQMKKLRVPAAKPKAIAKKEPVMPPEKPTIKKRGFEGLESKGIVPLPKEFLGKFGDGVVFIADGDGMRNAGIQTGDWLVFDIELQPQDGDIVAAKVNGNMMCRRYFREGEQYRIRREDGCTPDIVTSDCVILGVMIGLLRRYADRR